MTEASHNTIKEIVTNNFRAAAIFEKHSIDFCCNGGVTIQSACAEKGIDPSVIMWELSGLSAADDHVINRFNEWDPVFLIDYIMANHHSYVAKMIPILYQHTQKISDVHGSRHPELTEIAAVFSDIAEELHQHMKKEEMILFPYVKQLSESVKQNKSITPPPFGSAKNPIGMMEEEHRNAGDALYKIRTLTSNYTIPKDACTTYAITFKELREFELDLHQHVHLENNILFPKAIQLEQTFVR